MRTGSGSDREGGGNEKVPLSKAVTSKTNKDSKELKHQAGQRSEGELRAQSDAHVPTAKILNDNKKHELQDFLRLRGINHIGNQQ